MSETAESAIARMAHRKRVLEAAAIKGITGLVHIGGPRIMCNQTTRDWSLWLTLTHWRLENGAVQPTPLCVSAALPEAEARSMWQRIPALSVVRLRARLAFDLTPNQAEGLFVEFLGFIESDAELIHFAEEMQKPMSFHDEQFGEFTLNRKANLFSGKARWNSEPVELRLRVGPDANYDLSLKVAKLLWDKQSDWNDRAYRMAINKLLDLKNSKWLAPGEEPVGEEHFWKIMQPRSVIVDSSGLINFWFADGGLFRGRHILVTGRLATGPGGATLVG